MTDRPGEVPGTEPTSGTQPPASTEPVPPLDWATAQAPTGEPGTSAAPAGTSSGAPAAPPPARPSWQRWVAGGGLVLAGVLAGAGLAVALDGGDDTVRVRGVAWHGREGWPDGRGQQGQGQQGQGQRGPGQRGPGQQGQGRVDGVQRQLGTVSAVTDKTVTITVSGKDTTYTLTDTSLILVDGKPATIADVEKGDLVLVRAQPSSDGKLLVERLFAGTLPQRG